MSNNQTLRLFFSLPLLKTNANTSVAFPPTLPDQKHVTGDTEIDAVLWLRELIKSGDGALIAQAKEAATRIKTPLADLEKRYTNFLCLTNPGNPFATFASFNFADLDRLANQSIEKAMLRQEAMSRFGTEDALFADTPAEVWCIKVLKGVKREKHSVDVIDVAARFHKHPDLLPFTISDCLYELAYWDSLYKLRGAFCLHADGPSVAWERECFIHNQMAVIIPSDRDEALQALEFILSGVDPMEDVADTLRNLVRWDIASLPEFLRPVASGHHRYGIRRA